MDKECQKHHYADHMTHMAIDPIKYARQQAYRRLQYEWEEMAENNKLAFHECFEPIFYFWIKKIEAWELSTLSVLEDMGRTYETMDTRSAIAEYKKKFIGNEKDMSER